MPPRTPTPELDNPESLLTAVRRKETSLKQKYQRDPAGLAEKLGVTLPRKPAEKMKKLGLWDEEVDGPIRPGLRDLVIDVCTGEIEDAAAVGPRGGGKSKGVSFIEFFLVFILDYDALNLGGSELQADQVYQYLLEYIESDEEFRNMVKGEPLASKTTTLLNAWIRVLTASQKSVRSPHAGGRKKDGRVAGGLLVIDEEAEAEQEIVEAALPTINTAVPSVNVRCSTFHNATGSFAELIKHHVSMGYKLYSWDIFDIVSQCDCVDGCESKEPCFREDHVEKFEDPETGEEQERLIHKAYCGGRSRYAEGWLPINEAEKLWRRLKRNHNRWEVEAMGSRPSVGNKVIRDLTKFDESKTKETGLSLYESGYPVEIDIDWGAINAGITVWQEKPDKVSLLAAELLHECGLTEILGKITEYWDLYPECEGVAADIGGGGAYLNPYLRQLGIPTRDVNFGVEKEAAAAAMNVINESGLWEIPVEHEDFIDQAEDWQRGKDSRIKKGNDHLCDAALCYFSKYIEQLGLQNIRVAPRAINTRPDGVSENIDYTVTSPTERDPDHGTSRVPVAVSIGSSGRR